MVPAPLGGEIQLAHMNTAARSCSSPGVTFFRPDANTSVKVVSSIATPKFMLSTQLFILSLLTLYGGFANGSSDPELYTLEWPVKGEQLTYRSCGCGDECWVAELRTGTRRRLKAKLRCDCASLHAAYPVNETEQKRAESCPMNDAPDKMWKISEEMKALVEGEPKPQNR